MNRIGRLLLALVAMAGLVLAGCSSEGSNDPGAASGMSVDIQKIGVQSTLAPMGLNPDKTIQTPSLDEVQQAGYFTEGPKPGDVGPAVIVGHINGKGKQGVFARLDELKAGDKVTVTRDGKPLTFTVKRTQTVEKNKFPTAEVYSDTKDAELRLITCGGDLDRSAHSYKSNVIAFATLDA